MAGLIDTQMNTKLKPLPGLGQVQQADMTGYDAERRTVDQAKETVAGQLDTFLKSGSPVLERARASADQAANRRGLINTTMGVQAGEAAAIDAALPVASADASIYGMAARDNQAAGNRALEFTAGSKNAGSQFNAAQANELSRISQAAEAEKGLIGARIEGESKLAAVKGDIERSLQSLKGEQATAIANIEANYKSLLQASASSAGAFSETARTIAAINVNPDLTPENKAAAVAKQIQLLQASLTVSGAAANIDIGGLLDFGAGGLGRAFDGAAYLAANPDLQAGGMTPAQAEQHYFASGKAEGRQPFYKG